MIQKNTQRFTTQQMGFSKLTEHTFSGITQSSQPYSALESVINSTLNSLDIISGKVIIQRTAGTIVILIPYYISNTDESLTSNQINILGQQLASIAPCPVELRLVRLFSSYLDADVLAKFLSRELESGRFRTVILNLFTHIGPIKPYTNLDIVYTGAILGIKVRLAGRLTEEPSLPRQTIKTVSIGTFASKRIRILQASSYTTTNIKGAYTVKVWLAIKA